MKFLMNDPFKGSSKRLAENELYEIVTNEVMNEEVMAGIWGKAFADTEGDEQKAKALYIKYRVQDLKDRVIVETERGEQLDNHTNTSGKQTRVKPDKDKVGRENGSNCEVKISVVQCPKCKSEVPTNNDDPSFFSFLVYSRITRFLFWIVFGAIVFQIMDYLAFATVFTSNPLTFLGRLVFGFSRFDWVGVGFGAYLILMYSVVLFAFFRASMAIRKTHNRLSTSFQCTHCGARLISDQD